jgi:hypothetical protein
MFSLPAYTGASNLMGLTKIKMADGSHNSAFTQRVLGAWSPKLPHFNGASSDSNCHWSSSNSVDRLTLSFRHSARLPPVLIDLKPSGQPLAVSNLAES